MRGSKAKAIRQDLKAYYGKGFGPVRYTQTTGKTVRCLGMRSLYLQLKDGKDFSAVKANGV